MSKSLITIFVFMLFLGLPALSNAAYVNYSGVVTGATAKFFTNNTTTGKLDSASLKMAALANVKNAGLKMDRTTGTLNVINQGDMIAKLDHGMIWLYSYNIIPAGNNKLIGNVDVVIYFFTGTVDCNITDGARQWSGSGKAYYLSGAAEAQAVENSDGSRLVLKLTKLEPWDARVFNVTDGVVDWSWSHRKNALVTSISVPAITLERQ